MINRESYIMSMIKNNEKLENPRKQRKDKSQKSGRKKEITKIVKRHFLFRGKILQKSNVHALGGSARAHVLPSSL